LRNRQLEKAEQAYKELVSIQENSSESLVALADFYAAVNREDEAIDVFNNILKNFAGIRSRPLSSGRNLSRTQGLRSGQPARSKNS
jgi:predicted Zn-dependent protease